MIAKNASLTLSAGFALLGIGLLAGSDLCTAMGASLVIYVLISWLFFTPTEIVLFSNAVRARRSISKQTCVSGEELDVELRIENSSPFSLRLVKIADHTSRGLRATHSNWSCELKSFSAADFRYSVRPLARGVHRFTGIELLCRDACGLFFTQTLLPVVDEVVAQPRMLALGSIRKFRISKGLKRRGLASEFAGIRQYFPGDPLKYVNWKASSRCVDALGRSRLMVNEFEGEVSSPIMIILDVSYTMAYGGKLSYAAEAAAAFVGAAIRSGDPVGLVTFSDRVYDVLPPMNGRLYYLRVLKALTFAEPRFGYDSDFYFHASRKVAEHISSSYGVKVPEPWTAGKVADVLSKFYGCEPSVELILRYIREHGIDVLDIVSAYGLSVKSIEALREAFRISVSLLNEPSVIAIVSDLEFSGSVVDALSKPLAVARSRGHSVIVTSFFSPTFERRLVEEFSADETLLNAVISVHTDRYSERFGELERELARLRVPLVNITSGDVVSEVMRHVERVKMLMGAER